MPWLDINQERHHAYAGYEGMVELVVQIDKALSNPVWQQVRLPEPWAPGSGVPEPPPEGAARPPWGGPAPAAPRLETV
jgi:nitrogenase molybdenum-cofactor synthesis protein NifE